jgi:gas vesicle protein GvpA/GvpJ/GvpM family
MALRKSSGSMAELLDRVLDKGIVIDGWMSVSLAGIDLVGVKGRVVVASLATYSKRSKTIDWALGRERRAVRVMTDSSSIAKPRTPREQRAPAKTAVDSPGLCPLCHEEGRRQELVLVTVRTSAEARATARCSVCGWQRTYAE